MKKLFPQIENNNLNKLNESTFIRTMKIHKIINNNELFLNVLKSEKNTFKINK